MTHTITRLYWRHIRRHPYELCNSCGCPVGLVWHASEGLWNYVVAGQERTTYTFRRGLMNNAWAERSEGVGGIRCIPCFDREAYDAGVRLKWEPSPL